MVRLLEASSAWLGYKRALDDGSVTFDYLSRTVPVVLGNKADLSILARTAEGFEREKVSYGAV